MKRRSTLRNVFGTLRFRLFAMMSVALFPIGLIAVVQTQQLSQAARTNAELSLLSLTEHATLNERLIVERARGNARLLGHLKSSQVDADECARDLGNFIKENPHFSFVGFVPKSGKMTCSSAGRPIDFSDQQGFSELMQSEAPAISINLDAPLSGQPEMVVSEPYFENGRMAGMVSIFIPQLKSAEGSDTTNLVGFVNAFTFNAAGDVLTQESEVSAFASYLPQDVSLAEIISDDAYSFSAKDRLDNDRVYTFLPIENGLLYSLGIWDAARVSSAFQWSIVPSTMFPLLMWVSSLVVALFAVYRLVLRHIRELGNQMRNFARKRIVPKEQDDRWAPAEISELNEKFIDLSMVILRDEAAQENNLRDKNVLMKEIHHRVKNNLQLISSIINMQIRKAHSSETKAVLGRVQDRVLSLATIHRDLYQTSTAGLVDASALIKEIVEKSIEIGAGEDLQIDLKMTLEPIHLYPDQAVPVSLLASEAATNAMKYLGKGDKGRRSIDVSFTRRADEMCHLVFENTVDNSPDDAESTGLGAQLIRAFSLQLGGKIEIEEHGDRYRMDVVFKATEFSEEPVDF